MRSVAITLLILSSGASLKTSNDGDRPSDAARSTPRHFLFLRPAIAATDGPTPLSPRRREPTFESAFDEEESNDIDPLGLAPEGVASHPAARLRREASAEQTLPTSAIRPDRSRRLRC